MLLCAMKTLHLQKVTFCEIEETYTCVISTSPNGLQQSSLGLGE